METKVLDDGSAYAKIRSKDGMKAIQFIIVPSEHDRNIATLRDYPIQKSTEEFHNEEDFRDAPL